MLKTKVILAALLVAAVPTVSMFASCGGDKAGNETTGNEQQTENGAETDAEVDRLATQFSPNVPEGTKFDGETFGLLIGSVGQKIYAEEETSALVNDAVYRRNNLIAEHFGIEMNIVKGGYAATGGGQQEAAAQFRSLIEANDDTYHVFTHVQHTGMPQMILEKYFVDWNTVPYINLDDEWWHQGVRDELCFGDKVYVMTGDYALYVDSIDCLVFNKDIFDALELEYPYQDVLDGTWTWDKFEELVAKGAKDLNGDGLMSAADDQWGISGWVYELAPALLVCSGYSPLEKDADGMPILNQNVDEAHEIYDRITNLFVDGQKAWSESSDYNAQISMFTEGRSMFRDTFLGGITGLSDVEFEFGIIPYPKWDENSEYQNRSSNMTALTYIPVTNSNLELTGAVLEELSYQSAKEVTPLYFDTVLTVKSTRDVESEDMRPIIKNNARFLYHDFSPSIIGMVQNKNNTYASTYASSLSAYQEKLDEMRELLTE
ncbi:MAG: carbohydrate ABC transporter substrate-binding protein [Clostridia bacterium]|nr:carbohydrate ABC transporter substrate-binding protein [Clostridia bacterium]